MFFLTCLINGLTRNIKKEDTFQLPDQGTSKHISKIQNRSFEVLDYIFFWSTIQYEYNQTKKNAYNQTIGVVYNIYTTLD